MERVCTNTAFDSRSPFTAVLWAGGIYLLSLLLAGSLGEIGLYGLYLADGRLDTDALSRVTMVVLPICVLIVVSRLRTNPADVLALRPPAKLIRATCIVLALVVAVTIGQVILGLLEDAFIAAGGHVPANHNQSAVEKLLSENSLLSNIITTVVLTAISEELLFRGLILRSFGTARLWFWVGAVTSSVLFALFHNSHSLNFFLHAPYILGGLASAAGLRFTGSLWAPISMHALHNAIGLVVQS